MRLFSGISRDRQTENMRLPYFVLDSLEHLYLEDSYVLNITEAPESLEFEIDAVLTEEHVAYLPPPPKEKYCYLRGSIIFPNTRKVIWMDRSSTCFHDASGECDYGNIDEFYKDDDGYHLAGDWGSVVVRSDEPRFVPKT